MSTSNDMTTTVVQNKEQLQDLLMNEGYDTICIDSDGEWSKSGGTECSVSLRRVYHYDLSQRDVQYLIKWVECTLNGKRLPCDYDYVTGRARIQKLWESL